MRHQWKSAGGMKENPGVWGIPGNRLVFVERCEHCKLVRRRVYRISERKRGPWHYSTGTYLGAFVDARDSDAKLVKRMPCETRPEVSNG